jgi:hypothetical protein
MVSFRLLRTLLLAIASFGYLANGAQAHLAISQGEHLDLMLCSTSATRTITLELPGAPAEETEDTCCGDCAPVLSIEVDPPRLTAITLTYTDPVPAEPRALVSPRSPLWPGAPPHGPPHIHKATI